MKRSRNSSSSPIACLLIAAMAAIIAITGCGDGTNSAKDSATPAAAPKRLTIICTTPVLSEIASRLIGDEADVFCLLHPGDRIDHLNLRAADFVAISDATIVFTHGHGLEGQLIETITTTAPKATLIRVREAIQTIDSNAATQTASPLDWMDPGIYHTMIDIMRDAISASAPQQTAAINTNAQAFHSEINTLDKWMTANKPNPLPLGRPVITNSPTTSQLLRTFGRPVANFTLTDETTATKADEDRLLALLQNSKAGLLLIDDSTNEITTEMFLRIARSIDTAIVRTKLRDWPDSKTGYVQFMTDNVTALNQAMEQVAR